ncbi:MAG: hypothetical protein QM733_19020 [Ilumatobacteraceae bacterium]
MHRTNTELQWYLRHEWERRLRHAEWGRERAAERTAPSHPRGGGKP